MLLPREDYRAQTIVWPVPCTSRGGPNPLMAEERRHLTPCLPQEPPHLSASVADCISDRALDNAVPINRLPFELLAKIFALRLQSERLYWHPDVGPAGALCRVCHRWKAVVETTAGLWCIIGHRLPHGFIRRFLEKSKGLPLTVRLSRWTCRLDESEVLKTALSRWRVVELTGDGLDAWPDVFEHYLPDLECLRLTGDVHLPTKAQAPRLCRVLYDTGPIFHGPFALHGLRSLVVVKCGHWEVTSRELYSALLQSPELEELYIEGCVLDDIDEQDIHGSRRPPSIHLPQLKQFVYTNSTPYELGSLLLDSILPSFTGAFAIDVLASWYGSGGRCLHHLTDHLRPRLHRAADRWVGIDIDGLAGLTVSVYAGRPFHYIAPVDPCAFGVRILFDRSCSPVDLPAILAPFASLLPNDYETTLRASGINLPDVTSLFPRPPLLVP